MVTALAPAIGYEKAAKLAQRAMVSGQTIRELAQQEKVLADDELAKILDPWRMTPAGSRGLKANSHSYSFTIGKNLHVGKVHTKHVLGYLLTNLAFLQKQGIIPLFGLGTWLDTSLSLLILLGELVPMTMC
jgi:hypothetical protein